MATIPTVQGGLVVTETTPAESVTAGMFWHKYRDQYPRRIVAVRKVSGGVRLTDQFGATQFYRAGDTVPTAVVIGNLA